MDRFHEKMKDLQQETRWPFLPVFGQDDQFYTYYSHKKFDIIQISGKWELFSNVTFLYSLP